MKAKLARRDVLRSSAIGAAAALLAACGATPAATTAPAAEPTATTAPGQAEATAAPAEAEPTATTAAAAEPTATEAVSAPTEAPTAAVIEGEGQYGGTYRLISSGFVSLDPPGAEVSADWWMAGTLLYSYLYSYDPDGKIFPDLAAEMPALSDDGLVYTIPLRHGVKFHNGREMVADDVKFSLDRSLWPETYSWGKQFMQNIVGYDEVIAGSSKELSGVKVLDDYTIEITLKTPQAVFPAILSMTMNGIIPHQEMLDAGEDWGVTKAIGTGPFKFVEWVQGQKVTLERNPDFFRQPYPYFDRVEIYLDVEDSVAMMRWESNEVEWVSPPSAEVPRILTDPQFEPAIRKGPSLGMNRLFFRMDSETFQDIRVRQAVAMAIDKQAMVQASSGLAVVQEGLYTPVMAQFDPAFKSKYQYDPEAAKALLAEAGFPDGIKGIKSSGYEITMDMVQADLAAIGIELDWYVSTAETFDQFRAGELPFGMHSWGASFPDGFDYVSGWVTCASARAEGTYNFGNYCNEKIDQLMAQAEKLAIDSPERLALYREIQDIAVNQDVAIIPLTSGIGLALSKPYVHGDVRHFIFGHPALERAWMEQG